MLDSGFFRVFGVTQRREIQGEMISSCAFELEDDRGHISVEEQYNGKRFKSK